MALTKVTGSGIEDGTLSVDDIANDAVTADKLANSINTDIATGVTGNTTANAALPKAGGTMTGDLSLADGVKATFGNSDDLQIYHDGSNSWIKDDGTGDLIVSAANLQIRREDTTQQFIRCFASDRVELYHAGARKLATTSTGIDVTGSVTCDGLLSEASTKISHSGGLTLTQNATAEGLGYVAQISAPYANESFRIAVNGNKVITTEGYNSATKLVLHTNGSERMCINSAGNVGIGTTSPATKLHVYGTARFGNTMVGDASAGNLPLTPLHVKSSGTGAKLRIEDSDSSNLAFDFLVNQGSGLSIIETIGGASGDNTMLHIAETSGNVGIGTAAPTRRLTVQGSSSDNVPIRVVGGAGTIDTFIDLKASNTTADYKVRVGAAADDLSLYAGGSEKMRIHYNGNVGIGTNSPSTKLDVAGVIRATNVQTSAEQIDLTALSNTMYYPVVLHNGSSATFNNYELTAYYGSNYSASVFCKFDFSGFSWGGNPVLLYVDSLQHTYVNLLGAIGKVGYYKPVMYLRGGKNYNIKASSGVTPDIVTSINTNYYSHPNSAYHYSIGPISEATMQANSTYLGMTAITTRTSKSGTVQLA